MHNAEDFLLEIEHLTTVIHNREKQMQPESIKVNRQRCQRSKLQSLLLFSTRT